MHTLYKYALLFVFLTVSLQACKDEEENTLSCDDALLTNPVYTEGIIQMKLDGEMMIDTNFDQTFRYDLFPDSTAKFALTISWDKQNNNAFTDIFVRLFYEVKVPYGDTSTPQDVYESLAPRVLPPCSANNYHEIWVFTIDYPVQGQFYTSYSSDINDPDNHFEITSRSPMFAHPDGYLATRIEGTFCCPVYHIDTDARKTLQGNFSGVARLEW